jgi:hypothetical protein
MLKPALSLALALTALCALLSLPPAVDAQRKRTRTRRPVRVRLYISPEKIGADLVGQTVEYVPTVGGDGGRWQFAADEWKKITVTETKPEADTATLVISIRTGDSRSELRGKLRLYYERAAGDWILNAVENIDARLIPNTSALNSPRSPSYGPPVTPDTPPRRAPQYLTVANSNFALPPGYMQTFTINIPYDSNGGRVAGRFQATQGNNVQAHILDDEGLINLRNRSQYRSYYESGRVTVGTIDVRLAPGTYYLVFENFYSTFSNKVVQANVTLEF